MILVLGVSEDLRGDFPGLSVRNLLLVNEDSHELGNSQGWMRVIHYGQFRSQSGLTLNANIVG